jgi:choline monooxygenase
MSKTWHRSGYSFDPSATSSLPASAYDDQRTFAIESQRLFAPGSGLIYLGHDLSLPAVGHRRSDADPRIVLTRDQDGVVRALANVCTHACRPLLVDDAPVHRPRLRCPFHDWTFRSDGTLIGGANFDFGDSAACSATKDRLALTSYEVLSWHGFHFAVDPEQRTRYSEDLAGIDTDFEARGIADWLDFRDWIPLRQRDDRYRGDWKLFLEVFGDCYHVPPYHPGLASFVDCSSIEWTFGESFHVQFLELSARRGDRSTKYAEWADGLDRYYERRGDPPPALAVAWVALYPNLMLEAYNGLRVISILVPDGFGKYVNRVHYFVPADMDRLVPGLSASIIEAYDETVEEDKNLVDSRRDGMLTAASLGLEFDRYSANLEGAALEAGVPHFQQWWSRRCGDLTASR